MTVDRCHGAEFLGFFQERNAGSATLTSLKLAAKFLSNRDSASGFVGGKEHWAFHLQFSALLICIY